jgi:hypothetical protein
MIRENMKEIKNFMITSKEVYVDTLEHTSISLFGILAKIIHILISIFLNYFTYLLHSNVF